MITDVNETKIIFYEVEQMSIFSKNQTKKVVVNADNHGYKPEVVTFKVGKPAQLKFIPSDNMGCMNEIVSQDLNFDKKLNANDEVTINIPTDKPGTYAYACGMDMFHGKVVFK